MSNVQERTQELDDLFTERLKSEGIIFNQNSGIYQLSEEQRKKSRRMLGMTAAQLVYLAFENNGTTITTNDVAGTIQQALESRWDASLDTQVIKGRGEAKAVTLSNPIIGSNMRTVIGPSLYNNNIPDGGLEVILPRLGGMGILHQFGEIKDQVACLRKVKKYEPEQIEIDGKKINMALDNKGRYLCAAAVGINGDNFKRAKSLINAGVDVIVVDTAHGHSEKVRKMVKDIKNYSPSTPLMAGNIATPEAAYDLIQWGVDSIKANIGAGATCQTRSETGVGIPMLTSLIYIVDVAREYDVTVIADGGIKKAGDIVKCMGFGADGVIIGTNLAGTEQSNDLYHRISEYQQDNKTPYKVFTMGSASREAKQFDKKPDWEGSEGEKITIKYVGDAIPFIISWLTRIRSGMSYHGAKNFAQLKDKSRWHMPTLSGQYEGHKGR